MPTIEERVATLEARVDQLAYEGRHTTDVAFVAAREALTAQEAHRRNIDLLNALRKTQMEQGQRMDSIDRRMDSIDGRMDSIDSKLGVLTVGMHTIESLLRGLTRS